MASHPTVCTGPPPPPPEGDLVTGWGEYHHIWIDGVCACLCLRLPALAWAWLGGFGTGAPQAKRKRHRDAAEPPSDDPAPTARVRHTEVSRLWMEGGGPLILNPARNPS